MFSYKEYLKPIQIKGLIQRFMKTKDISMITDMDEVEDVSAVLDALEEIRESFEYVDMDDNIPQKPVILLEDIQKM